jgi:hypothetical protein
MNIKDKLHKIKLSRYKPEELFLYKILNKVEIIYDKQYPYTEHNPYNEYFYVNGEILFQHDLINNSFIVHGKKIWSVLRLEYNLEHDEIQTLIQNMVFEILEKNISKPFVPISDNYIGHWNTIKMKLNRTQ